MKKYRAYEVLRQTGDCFLIKVDVRAYSPYFRFGRQAKAFSLSQNNRSAAAMLAFNANYFGKYRGSTWPIGVCWDGLRQRTVDMRKSKIRSVLAIMDPGFVFVGAPIDVVPLREQYRLIAQAGPRLVAGGEVDIRSKKEAVPSDAVRRAPQLSVGMTVSGKLLVCYTADWEIQQIAYYLREHGAIEAMKMDGGHAAFLAFNPDVDDNDFLPVQFGNPGIVPVAIELVRK